MRRLALPTTLLGLASALSACDASDRGFVQIETVPEYASTFYIGEQKLPPLNHGGSSGARQERLRADLQSRRAQGSDHQGDRRVRTYSVVPMPLVGRSQLGT